MHRYIAFAWNNQIEEKTCIAQSLVRRMHSAFPAWDSTIKTAGLQVYHCNENKRSGQAYVLDENAGVVLGQLFERSADGSYRPQNGAFDPRAAYQIRKTKGRHLVDQYWGRYVALLREEREGNLRILRDPSGAMPCLTTRYHGIDVVASDIDVCWKLGLIKSAINWGHIAAYLWFDDIVNEETGLEDVRQVQSGECIAIDRIGRNMQASFYWSPDRIHDQRVVENRHEAMVEVRNVVQSCVSAWASSYDSILHELSGGLDSAIVLACLSNASVKPSIICENYFTESAKGDERHFAREAASRVGAELIETPIRSFARPVEGMFDSTKLATPTLMRLIPEVEAVREQLINERGIEAVFSGQGGDHFFQRTKTALIAAEYAYRHGLRPHIFNVITDTARLTGRSAWSVMAAAVKSGIFRQHEDPYEQLEPPPLVSDVTRDAIDRNRIRHSWISSSKHLPGSKILQTFNVIDSQKFYRTRCQFADIVHPLISQPIIEVCLQIPSYILTYGGIDRALVRDGFADMISSRIRSRTGKGATTSYINGLLVRNLPSLRKYLLGGILVAEGILDKKRIETKLSEGELVRDPNLLFPTLNAIRAEAWLRSWIGESKEAAA